MENGRRQFLTAAAGFAVGAAIAPGAADAATPLTTLLNGIGAPRKTLGRVGDFYIDDRAHAIYGPKRASGWGRATSLIGPAGSSGTQGASGAPGSAGTSGGNGTAGTPGSQGAAGDQGPQGAQGPRGYEILHGSGAPTASDGEDNDFYIDTAATQLYGPKENGAWGPPVSLIGQSDTDIDGGSL